MNRRNFLKISSALALAATGLYTYAYEPEHLEFVRLKMPIKQLPEFWKGKTLIQFSDLHIGKDVDDAYIINAFEKAKIFNPDIVVFTGDFVTYQNFAQIKHLSTILQHAPKGKYLTCGVLGNHDYGASYNDKAVGDAVQAAVEENGISILRNKTLSLNDLNILGIEDYWGPNFSETNVKNTISESNAHIVLCHNPDVADLPIWDRYANWILSGHTHGGQCKPPFLAPPLLPVKNKKFTSGLFVLDHDRHLYINRALGNLNHIRFNVRPEVTIFEMV